MVKKTREDVYEVVASVGLADKTWQRETIAATINAISTIIGTLDDGDSLELRGLGVFRATWVAGKKYHNVRTRRVEESDGRIVVKFTASSRNALIVEDDDLPAPKATKPEPEYVQPIRVKKQHVPPVTKYNVDTDRQSEPEQESTGEDTIVKLHDLKEIREFVIRKVKSGYPWSSFDYEDYIADEHHDVAKAIYRAEFAKQQE